MRAVEIPPNLPFSFVLDDLAELNPVVGRMFGCFSIYVGAKIVLILRSAREPEEDNGVWIATTMEHHESLRKDLKSMRDILIFGPGPTGWQVLPENSDSFEEDVNKVCQLILKGDVRVGKIPAKKKAKAPSNAKTKPKLSKSPKKAAKIGKNPTKPKSSSIYKKPSKK